jgi:carbon monoxide dehydrogenase subunit G
VRIEAEARVGAPPDELWALVDDLAALGGCIPGASDVRVTGPDRLEATLHQQVGPIGLTFQVHVRLAELDRPTRAVVEIDGEDRRLAARVHQHQEISFQPDGDGTLVRIAADVQVAGRLATFGQRVIEAKAGELADGMIANIDALVRSRRAPAGG